MSRVPSSAHAVRFAPRNRAAEAPDSRGFRGAGCCAVAGEKCLQEAMAVRGLEEVPSMESALGAGYLPRLMLSASLPEIALRRHPAPGAFVGGECCVSAGEKCLQEAMDVPWLGGVPSMKYAREVGTFLGSCCPLRFQKSPVEAPASRAFRR